MFVKDLEMDQAEFRLWARYVYDVSGIFLEPAKAYLAESRLGPLLQEFECRTFRRSVSKIQK